MFLKGDAATNFPELKEYIYRRFPKVMGSNTIVTEMGLWGDLDEHSFRAALMPGTPPFVQVRIFEPARYGMLDKTYPGVLALDWGMVNDYEENRWSPKCYFQNAKGQDVPIIGAILLCLLCEWGAFRAWGRDPRGSAGQGFAENVYGISIDI